MSGGNYRVILCERGVRTFADHSRNTLDLSVIPPARGLSHLPILVDPSHGTGRRDHVPPMALAALAAGADGLLVEVHPDPDRALSDGAQSLDFDGFDRLLGPLRPRLRAPPLPGPVGHRRRAAARGVRRPDRLPVEPQGAAPDRRSARATGPAGVPGEVNRRGTGPAPIGPQHSGVPCTPYIEIV